MKMLNILITGVAMAGASVSAVAPAQAPTAVSVTTGAKVLDTKGGEVGTIESVTGDLAVVNTGTNKVALPTSSFGKGDAGLLLAMTKAELDAAASSAAADAKAELAAQLKPGVQVTDTNGGAVGKIEAADAEFVTVATATSKVRLPTSAFAKGANGPVIAMTAAELDAASKKSATPGG